MSKEFYTYAYLREDRTPYYIGKGKGRRAWDKDRKGARRPKDNSRILILKRNLTEKEAFRHEKYMIFLLGRKNLGTGILRNLTDGGEGSSGYVPTEETRLKLSDASRGRKHTKESRIKISKAKMGERHPYFRKRLDENHRRKMSEVKRGKKNCNSKSFVFISPSGEKFLVTGEFKAFCREQGIAWQTMHRALCRNSSPPPLNGWLVYRAVTGEGQEVCYDGVALAQVPPAQPPSTRITMSDSNLFITASRKKFRFASERGDLTVENLWDLPLTSKNGFNLNAVAIGVNAELKGLAEESFVETSTNPRRKDLENMLDLIKYVISVKQEEAKAATERVAKQELKRKLREAIEAKEGEALQSASLDDLKAQLAALG